MAFVSRFEIYIAPDSAKIRKSFGPFKIKSSFRSCNSAPPSHLTHQEKCEIVYDSIIQNKHKTKTYWEQLMMAAEMGTQPPAPPLLKQFNGDCQDDKAHSEISEDFYDAESHNSLNSPELHSLEAGLVGPKIVEKVAKKLLEAVESRPTKRATEESVIEREIKLQRERELALVREREAAAAKAQARAPEMKTLGGSLSPEVTTVLKEADDEWRRRSCKDEDLFNSIPTTDEGNCSEYGSEGKDDFSPETNNSRVMSPEVEMGGQIHQRTQSMDSMSSGHSSGSSSGLSSHLDCSYVSVNARRRGITVKPLDEPEEENSTFFRNERETPIEREIRLAREREEELRREKNNIMNNIIKSNENPPTHQNKTMNSTNFSSRNSINVEQELLIIKAEENIDVQSKVNQLNSLSQRSKSNDKKPAPLQLKKHLSKSVVNLSCAKELESELTVPSPTSPAAPNSHFKKFVGAPATQKRGLMKRFLESRGKLGSTFTLNAPALNSEPIKKLSTFSSPNSNQNCVSVVNAPPRKHYVKKIQNKEENSSIGTRPGYKSAEEKIQNELMEMRRREEELRRQRAFSLARSQPNLLSLIDGEGEIVDNEKEKDIEILDRLPPMSKLRTALSNPNLLDVDEKPVQKKIQQRKKSALITEWENRIQKNIE
nr:PREDICTED: uncharacterized protein LOC109034307 isoform X2 [Bemisia tabaci]